MKLLDKLYKNWDVTRIIRATLGVLLLVAYYFNREQLFAFAGIILSIQAIFNISCAGGNCSTTANNSTKPVMEIKKYEPKK